MNENGKVRFIFSWPAIILGWILFWPIGLVLTFIRVAIDYEAAHFAAKVFKVIGILWCLFTILTVVITIGDLSMNDLLLVMGVFYIPIAVLLLWGARRLKKKSENRRIYVEMLTNGGVRSLETLSASTGESIEVVKKEVKRFIKSNVIRDAYIDESTKQVVFAKHDDTIKSTAETSTDVKSNSAYTITKETAPAKNIERKVVCENCGATNTIYGASGECEYCGSSIK